MKNAKEMLISSVKLVNNGLKGIEVTYAMPTTKNSRSFLDEHKSKKKAPIHDELEELFISLKPFILDICDYTKETREKDIIETELSEIIYSDKGFILKGKKCVLQGDKTIDLKTPLITGDDYVKFIETTKILDRIYDEVKLYMSGEKTLSDEQIVIKFNEKKEEFDIDTFKKLSKQEQREKATEILNQMGVLDRKEVTTTTLEGMGALVIHSDEVGEAAEEIKEEEVIPEPVVEEFESFDEPVQESKPGALKMISDGDSFKVVANPIKQSTAKKIA